MPNVLHTTSSLQHSEMLGLYWFRRDLRLHDNPALYAAQSQQQQLLLIYIDDQNAHYAALGAAARWWTSDTLQALNKDLQEGLRIFVGDYATVLLQLCRQYQIKHVYANRIYDPIHQALEEALTSFLQQEDITLHLYHDELIDLQSFAQKHRYQVFSAFYNKVMQLHAFNTIVPSPTLNIFHAGHQGTVAQLQSTKNFNDCWQTGEAYAVRALEFFILFKLRHYADNKDYPALEGTSHLSAFLSCGSLSLRSCFAHTCDHPHGQAFVRQLIWSEFARYILQLHPQLPHTSLRVQFHAYPWQFDQQKFDRWTQGETGFAFIDAGMRQLQSCGFMNNRLRMNVASFLTKNLNIAWQFGERWFWDHLIDAQLANNSLNWQWVAGTALNTAPFTRIFNPQRQMMIYDPDLSYTKLYLPEVKAYNMKELQHPYRVPVVDLQQSRLEAIQNYAKMQIIARQTSEP